MILLDMEEKKYLILILGLKLKMKQLEQNFCEDKKVKLKKQLTSIHTDIESLINDYYD